MDGYLADHKMVTLQVALNEAKIGKSYWKINEDLLQDESLIKYLKTSIPRIIEDNDKSNVTREVLFETTMCVIRGEII